jgi:WD40 repeat protein
VLPASLNEGVAYLNLRTGKVNLSFSSNDVRWSMMRNVIGSAATNGKVVVWNVDRAGSAKQERVLTDHSRAVNRIGRLQGYSCGS